MKKIPDGWHEVTIEDIASVDSGQGAPQGDKWYNGEKIFIKAGDLNNLTEGKYVGDYCQRISNEAISHYNLKEYPANSIVFPKSGMSVKTDNIALLKYDSYVVNHLAIIKVNEVLCSEKYLYYLFKGKKISNLSLNDSYPSIRLQDIKSFKIPLPPLPTQKKIAAVLEKAEKLREWRKEADGLTDRFLEKTFLDMFGDPEKNPKGWDMIKFGEIVEASMNGFGRRSEENLERKPIVLRIQDIQNGYIDISSPRRISMSSEEFRKYELKENDFLYVRVNGTLKLVGKSAIVPEIQEDVTFSDHIVRIRFYQKMVSSLYVHFLTQTQYFRLNLYSKVVTTAGQNSLGFNRLSEILIPLPPLSLQQKFVSIVHQVEQVRQYQEHSKQQIDNFFNVLMQRAFLGELEAK